MRGTHWNIQIPITLHVCVITSGFLYPEAHMPVCVKVKIFAVSCHIVLADKENLFYSSIRHMIETSNGSLLDFY